jgi:predicted metal-dependent peptidase
MSIESIKYLPLKETIIGMQNEYKLSYYGYFSLYFNFVEDDKLPAAAGVTFNKHLIFMYNPILLDEYYVKYGSNFLKFLVIHEVNHILLKHHFRTGERNHELSNIAQDMIINYSIKKDFTFQYEDFFYIDKDCPQINFISNEYKELHVYELLYDFILNKNEVKQESNENGEGQESNKEGQESNENGEGQKSKGKRKELNKNDKDKIRNKSQGKLVDVHDNKEVSENEFEKNDIIIKGIHDSLKSRGLISSESIEEIFKFKKKRTIVSVFKRVFVSGNLSCRTYKKLSRRNNFLKGKKKEGKDINLIVDTSGSLYQELDKYMGQIIGNFNIYLIQIDTEIRFNGHIENINKWKKIKKIGGGGTILQPAIEHIIKVKRQKNPIYFISDFQCDKLDFNGIKSKVIFIKSKDSIDPVFSNLINYKIVS